MNLMRWLNCIVLVTVFVSTSLAQTPTDIEKNFTTANNLDLTGIFQVSGVLGDSSPYTGTLKLEKWNTFTTQRGGVLQSFKMLYTFGEVKMAGVAVFDGHRLYYAAGEGDAEKNNYYLLLLSKLELSTQASIDLYKLANAKAQKKEGHYVDWEGDPPWYGYIDVEAKGYGYWFWIDGIWGQYSVRKSEFPHMDTTGSFFMLELKKNGKFGKKQPFTFPDGYWEAGGFIVEPAGENVNVTVTYSSGSKRKSTWGTGMLVPDPLTGDTVLVVMIGGPNDAYTGYLDIFGKKMVGVWAMGGGDYQRSEEWVVPDDVLAKNPAWFK